jgi:hypothetical protein
MVGLTLEIRVNAQQALRHRTAVSRFPRRSVRPSAGLPRRPFAGWRHEQESRGLVVK